MKTSPATPCLGKNNSPRHHLLTWGLALMLAAAASGPARAADPGTVILGGAIGAGLGQAIGHNTAATVVGAATGVLLAHAATHPAPPAPRVYGYPPPSGWYPPPTMVYHVAPPPRRHHHWHHRHHHPWW